MDDKDTNLGAYVRANNAASGARCAFIRTRFCITELEACRERQIVLTLLLSNFHISNVMPLE